MTYISKTVSCKTIIAKVFATLRPNDADWVNRAYEDIGWAIQAIGYHTNFVNKSTPSNDPIEIKGFRALIPCDVERILSVERFIINPQSANILNPDGTTPTPEELDCARLKTVRLRLGADTSGLALSVDNFRTTAISPGEENYYGINGDYIVCGFEEGQIKLNYVGFNIDEIGLPVIVDDFDYKEACFWYVVKNMILKGYKNSEISYKDADAYFNIHMEKARVNVKVPTIDAAERFTAGWLRYSLRRELYDDFFMNAEQPEFTNL